MTFIPPFSFSMDFWTFSTNLFVIAMIFLDTMILTLMTGKQMDQTALSKNLCRIRTATSIYKYRMKTAMSRKSYKVKGDPKLLKVFIANTNIFDQTV